MDVQAEVRNPEPDALIARVAGRQHGIVTLGQLDAAGIRRQGRNTRLQRGRLLRIHRGVFAVGHSGLSREGRWMAAVLACGEGAVLSHTSAGELWEILRDPRRSLAGVRPSVPHVSVPTHAGTRRGIRVHRSRTLGPDQVTRRLNIPVTTPSRTLADLRRLLPQSHYAAALRQAEFLGLPIDASLGADHTRSELETRFLALCRRHRLPKPEVNVRVADFVVDFLWPAQRLIVEVDGYRAHSGREVFEADRRRDVQLKLLGYETVRFTWRTLTEDPAGSAVTLRRLLERAA